MTERKVVRVEGYQPTRPKPAHRLEYGGMLHEMEPDGPFVWVVTYDDGTSDNVSREEAQRIASETFDRSKDAS